jgi:hypothetical protein
MVMHTAREYFMAAVRAPIAFTDGSLRMSSPKAFKYSVVPAIPARELDLVVNLRM